jgi:hypothetical protein
MNKYLLRGVPTILLCVLFHLAAFSQERKVSGTVKDEKGTLLPGATVLVKGLKVATSTDVNGNFSGKTLHQRGFRYRCIAGHSFQSAGKSNFSH